MFASLFGRYEARPFPVLRFALVLAVLTLAFLAFGQTYYHMDNGAETQVSVIRSSSGTVAKMSAGSDTILSFDDKGSPNFIGFSVNGKTVEGEYGIDATGKPKNRGRLIFRQVTPDVAMPYGVVGPRSINMYHLKYLELTTAGDKAKGFTAYAVKAVVLDNVIETLSAPLKFTLPQDGQLAIINGKIKMGDDLITPNYDLSGTIERPRNTPTQTNSKSQTKK